MNWEKYTGSGVCDVCLRPVENCNSVYVVPNEVFYLSPKYKERISGLARASGMSPEEYLATMCAMDGSTGSAVCDQCIALFENDGANSVGTISQPSAQSQAPMIKDSQLQAQGEVLQEKSAVNEPYAEQPVEEKPVKPMQQPEIKAPEMQSAYSAAVINGQPTIQTQSVNRAKNTKASGKTLSRFPKGWMIFMIVAASCGMATFLPAFAGHADEIDALLMFLYLASIITGYVLMLLKKALGFIIALVGNLLLLYMGQTQIGNYLMTPTLGVPMTVISFFITMKQIDYRFWKHIKLPQPKVHAENPAQPTMPPNYMQAPVVAQIPVFTQAPVKDKSQNNNSGATTYSIPQKEQASPAAYFDAAEKPKAKANWLVIGGVAAFAVVVIAVLYVGLIRPVTKSEIIDTPTAQRAIQSQGPTASPKQQAGLTADQEVLFEEIKANLTEQFQSAARDETGDALVCAAVENLLYMDPVFEDSRIIVTVLLPDPRKDSLDSLNIARYEPFSGAQAYIKEAYQALKKINTVTNYLSYEVSLNYRTVYIDTKEIDWSFPYGTFALRDYLEMFDPHMEEYMKELGFYVAAQEILMPDFAAESSGEFINAYYASLADALSLKGIDYMGKPTTNTTQIEQLLKERFGQCFVYDRMGFDKFGHEPTLKMTTFTHMSFFHEVFQILDNQYETGRATPPESFEATEIAYMDMVKKVLGDMRGELAKGTTKDTMEHTFEFNWEKLGDEGVAACKGLIDEIEYFMKFYDNSLMTLEHFVGMRIYSQ